MTLRHRQADGVGFTREEVRRQVETRYPVMSELLNRWSPRSFVEQDPETDKLASIFEAARLAPSAHNSQPSRFIVGRRGQGSTYERLFSCLDPHNREWAHAAPVLVLGAVSQRRFSQATGDFVPYAHCMHDLGLAVMSLIVQAQHLGLHCHPMAAFDPERAQAEFSIPPLFLPGIMIALGYLGPAHSVPETVRAQETAIRIRRQLEELVFEEGWGQAAGLFAAVKP